MAHPLQALLSSLQHCVVQIGALFLLRLQLGPQVYLNPLRMFLHILFHIREILLFLILFLHINHLLLWQVKILPLFYPLQLSLSHGLSHYPDTHSLGIVSP
jgi:hypothetical protein